MANIPLVSVVIPAYNAAAYIDAAIRSVLKQDYPNLEVIVVDDGSTDGTMHLIAAYGERVLCHRQAGSGGYPGVPRNAGLRQCHGEFICFLDADDLMSPGRIRRQVSFLNEHPTAGAVFMDYRNFSAEGESEASHFATCPRLRQRLTNQTALLLDSATATAILLQENFGIPSTLMIRRSVLDVVPGFSGELRTSEDFHFYYRVARHYGIGVIVDIGARRRLHGNNVTGDTLRTLKNYIASRTDLRRDETSRENIVLLNRFLCKCEIELARAYANRREFASSIMHNLRAILDSDAVSFAHLALVMRTLIRTAAIATRLKSPCP